MSGILGVRPDKLTILSHVCAWFSQLLLLSPNVTIHEECLALFSLAHARHTFTLTSLRLDPMTSNKSWKMVNTVSQKTS